MKKILVTGGAGFVGSHLCDALLAKDYNVVCLDDLSTGSRSNIAHLIGHPRFEYVNHDVINEYDADVSQIFNLACPASPPHYQENPLRTMKISVFGIFNALELARRKNARVFQASTSEVYGDPTIHPQHEAYLGNVNPIGIRACYDEGKRCAETICFDYHRSHGVEIRVARIFNTYGPRMSASDGRVVSNFVVQALRGDDLTIYGQGQQTRSFCYVDDMVDAFIKLMEADGELIGPVNLGNPEEFTMLELAQMILNMTGSKSKLVFMPLPQDDPRQRRPDITRAESLLDWRPTTRLQTGLEKTVAYFEKLLRS